MSAGPAAPRRTAWIGWHRQHAGEERADGAGRSAATETTSTRGTPPPPCATYSSAGPLGAEPDGQRLLARHRVARDVAQVVGDQQGGGEQADRDRRQQAQPGDRLDLDVGRPDRGDHAEEDEHEHLAETEVAVRLRAAGVEPAGGDAQRTDDDAAPSRRQRPGASPTRPATPKHAIAARLTARGSLIPHPTRRTGPTRAPGSSVPRMPSE